VPPLPSPGAVIKVEFKINQAASIPGGSRFFLSYTGGAPNVTDLNTLATSFKDAWVTNFTALVNSDHELVEVTCTDLSSDTGAVGVWSGSEAGSRGGDFLPASACAVVNHQIERRYRGGRPRTYLIVGSVGDLNGANEWSTGFQGDVLTAWETTIASVIATGGMSISIAAIVNVSFYHLFLPFEGPTGRYRNIPQPRTPPLVDDITVSTVSIKLGSQRRRLNL
jgi:hypothetical protein